MIFFRRDFNYESTQKMWCFGLVFEIFPLKNVKKLNSIIAILKMNVDNF